MIAAKPFLKWAGGKSQLLTQLEPLFPKKFNGYHEPFVGSAAIFFHLYNLKRGGIFPTTVMKRVGLTDSNDELINCYKVIKSQVEDLIERLAKHAKKHSEDYYYRVRGWLPKDLASLERAARFIYLNKTCFNGLYRVNSKGQFNVPMGNYANPKILDADELRTASRALRGVSVVTTAYETVLQRVEKGDFIYFDPPYHPRSRTASFTSYTEDAFDRQHQFELSEVFKKLDEKGCFVMLSNSWTPDVLDLYRYRGYHFIAVHASRLINSNADRRGKIKELVVLNYDPERTEGGSMMSGKRKAVASGHDLRDKVVAIGEKLQLDVRTEVKVGKRLWGASRLIDVVMTDKTTRKALGIECKFQEGGGSVDEKIPTTINDIGAWPISGIVVLGGKGFREHLRSYLYSTGKAVDIEDLDDWLKLYFGL